MGLGFRVCWQPQSVLKRVSGFGIRVSTSPVGTCQPAARLRVAVVSLSKTTRGDLGFRVRV